MTILLALLSSVFKKILAVLTWCIDHWKIMLPALIVAVTIWQFHRVITERDAIKSEYAEHIKADNQAAADRKIENEKKKLRADAGQLEIKAKHDLEIQKLKGIDDAKYKDQQSRNNDTVAMFRERLRIELAKQTTLGLSDIYGTAEEPTQSGGNCDTAAFRKAYDTLEIACAVTTSDYNSLYESWEKACQIYGCN